MNNNHVATEQAFDVIGITIRTTNKAAVNNGTISSLWERFFAESIYSKIPNKVDHAVLALYYDFESDKNGEYNVLVGARVSSIDQVPDGMIAQHVATQKREVFISEQGPVNQVCFELWNKIWILEDQNEIHRSYIADYELYDERSQNPNSAQVAIHIGIK